jgi:hypothetical protein
MRKEMQVTAERRIAGAVLRLYGELDALFRAARALSKRGGGLALARPSPFCRDVLARVGLDRCIAIVDTDEAALEWLGERARPPAPAAR